jgi:hypothetical protein
MNRFYHSGPAFLFLVKQAPTVLVSKAATPADWIGSAVPLGTCERYPQMTVQVVREDVRNDLGGDNVIFKNSHGHKMTLQAELNRWSQTNLQSLIATMSGGAGTRQGVHNVMTMATPTDIAGNSAGILVWYPDVTNRNEAGYFMPLAVLMECSPTKVGNRTSAMSIKLESNTGFFSDAAGWYSFDYLKYQNGDPVAAVIDTGCKAAVATDLLTQPASLMHPAQANTGPNAGNPAFDPNATAANFGNGGGPAGDPAKFGA